MCPMLADQAQKQAGQAGEELVRDQLRTLQGDLISGFFRTDNLSCAGRQVQLDFLLMVPSIGLVLLEVKTWKGTIRANADDKWEREVNNFTNRFANGSLQVLRAAGLVLQMLEQERINRWPVRALVVFTHDPATIFIASGDQAPQTDIVRLSGLADWMKSNAHPEHRHRFQPHDFDQIRAMISKYHMPYVEQTLKAQVGDRTI
ncbi:MAG: hypothetical protein RLY58_819 [Pseudomonadota bacterium]|jgi:hypothetical protein